MRKKTKRIIFLGSVIPLSAILSLAIVLMNSNSKTLKNDGIVDSNNSKSSKTFPSRNPRQVGGLIKEPITVKEKNILPDFGYLFDENKKYSPIHFKTPYRNVGKTINKIKVEGTLASKWGDIGWGWDEGSVQLDKAEVVFKTNKRNIHRTLTYSSIYSGGNQYFTPELYNNRKKVSNSWNLKSILDDNEILEDVEVQLKANFDGDWGGISAFFAHQFKVFFDHENANSHYEWYTWRDENIHTINFKRKIGPFNRQEFYIRKSSRELNLNHITMSQQEFNALDINSLWNFLKDNGRGFNIGYYNIKNLRKNTSNNSISFDVRTMDHNNWTLYTTTPYLKISVFNFKDLFTIDRNFGQAWRWIGNKNYFYDLSHLPKLKLLWNPIFINNISKNYYAKKYTLELLKNSSLEIEVDISGKSYKLNYDDLINKKEFVVTLDNTYLSSQSRRKWQVNVKNMKLINNNLNINVPTNIAFPESSDELKEKYNLLLKYHSLSKNDLLWEFNFDNKYDPKLSKNEYDELPNNLRELFKVSKYKWTGHSQTNLSNFKLPTDIRFKRIYIFQPIVEPNKSTPHNYDHAIKYVGDNNNVLSITDRDFGKIVTIANEKLKIPNGYKAKFLWLVIDNSKNITNQVDITPPRGMRRFPGQYSPIRPLTNIEYNSFPKYTIKLSKSEYDELPNNLKELFKASKYKWSGTYSSTYGDKRNIDLPKDISFKKEYHIKPVDEDIKDAETYPDYDEAIKYIKNNNIINSSNFSKKNKTAYKYALVDKSKEFENVNYKNKSLHVKRIGVGFNKQKEFHKRTDPGVEEQNDYYDLYYLYSTRYPSNYNRKYKAESPKIGFFNWDNLLKMNIKSIELRLKGSSSFALYKGDESFDNSFLSFPWMNIWIRNISKKSFYVDFTKIDKKNSIYILDSNFKNNYMHHQSGIEAIFKDNGDIEKVVPYVDIFKNVHKREYFHEKTRYYLFPREFKFEFYSTKVKGSLNISNNTIQLPPGYESSLEKIEINLNKKAVTSEINIAPPFGMRRTPHEYSPIRDLKYEEYRLFSHSLKSKAKIGSLNSKIFINGIKAFGQNGLGYVNFDTSNLIKKGIANFKYEIIDRFGNEIGNFNIKNGDIIKYSFNYKSKKYQNSKIVYGLFSDPTKVFEIYKDDILKAITLNKNKPFNINFKIRKIKNFSSDNDALYKITLSTNMPSLNFYKGDYFYVVVSLFKNSFKLGKILLNKSTTGLGEANSWLWDYNDDGSFDSKIYVKFEIPKGTSFKPKEIQNYFSFFSFWEASINKIETTTKIEKYSTKVSYKEKISYINLPYVYAKWFDKKSSLGFKAIPLFFDGAIELVYSPITLALGAFIDLQTYKLQALSISRSSSKHKWKFSKLAMEKILKTPGFFENISKEDRQFFLYMTLAMDIALLILPGFGTGKWLGNFAKWFSGTKFVVKSGKFVKFVSSSLTYSGKIYKFLKASKIDLIQRIYRSDNLIDELKRDLKLLNELIKIKNPTESDSLKAKELFINLGKHYNNTETLLEIVRIVRESINEASSIILSKSKQKISNKGGIINLHNLFPWFMNRDEPIIEQKIKTKFNSSSSSLVIKIPALLAHDFIKSRIYVLGDSQIVNLVMGEKFLKDNDAKVLKKSYLN